MNYQYKIIVRNKRMCKEFVVLPDMAEVMLGTTAACGFRLNQDLFFSKIEISLLYTDGEWRAMCNDGIFFSKGDARKLYVVTLKHEDMICVRYAKSENEAFAFRFLIDFDYRIPDYNWYIDLSQLESISIGDREACDIRLLNPFSDDTYVEIHRKGETYIAAHTDSRFGILINGREITSDFVLEDCEFVSLADTSFYFRNGKLYFDLSDVRVQGTNVACIEGNASFRYPKFTRNTRRKQKINTEKILILDPSSKPTKPDMNIVTSLMPSIVMFALVVVLRGIMSTTGGTYVIFSICSMGLGVVTTVASLVQNRRKYKKNITERERVYRAYIEKKSQDIEKAREEEKRQREEIFYNTRQSIDKIMRFDADIFDRIRTDEDFLYVYLGTGAEEALRTIDYKHQEKLEEGDELTQLPEQIAKKYKYIEDVPVVLNLRDANAVGIAGDEKARYDLFKDIVTDLVARQYHTDVSFYFLLGTDASGYEWAEFLPQLAGDRGLRNVVFDSRTKTNIFENLYKELNYRSQNEGEYDHLIIFALADNGLTMHPLARFIEHAAALYVTFLFFEASVDFLPLYCSSIIECEGENKARIYSSSDKSDFRVFRYESISDLQMEKLVRKVAPVYCEEISLESTLRKNYSMFEMLNIYDAGDLDLMQRWKESRIDKTMSVPLGINAKGEPVCLDLHEKFHGPHGLVAGTTGSGKSELLQSYILSAATLFHPYEIGFVIIDFKGGGMVNQFASLPHLIGAITNIDGKEIDRSLKSIKAELLKRQELFAAAGVNHIDKYIRAFHEGKVTTALPHLVIIVDEFAELKAEQPEFMKELISAARIGRSLGVHLILATQKPAGQVNEQIWSNSKFKLCLKVQDQEDSKEVLKSPLAAEIKEPGRAYLQVGNNEIFELFQSAYSGGAAVREDESAQKNYRIYSVGMNGRNDVIFETQKKDSLKGSVTQLEAIVSHIAAFCEENGIEKLPNICLPALPDVLPYDSEAVSADRMSEAAVGIYDDPDHQYQGLYLADIGRENTIVIGGSQTGKTNFLQLCIRFLASHNSPKDVTFYILDFGSMILKNFEELKHVGGVVLASEDEKLKNLFKLLSSEVDLRKNRLMEAGVSSFAAYREAGLTDLPRIYLFADNFTAFKELYMDKYEADFVRLCRDGISLGISVVITNASSTGIGYRYLSNFPNRICFTCNDSSDYSNMLDRCRTEPKSVPGRLLFQKEKEIYEAQSFLAFDGKKEIDRVKAVKEFVRDMNEKYMEDASARKIPEIPAVLYRNDFERQYGAEVGKQQLPLGLNFSTIEPVQFDLREDCELAVISRKAEKTAGFIQRLMDAVKVRSLESKWNVFILDSVERNLACYKDSPLVTDYSMDSSQSELLIEAVLKELKRNKEIYIETGVSDSMSNNVLILNSRDAVHYISSTKPVMGLYKEMVEEYKAYGLLVLYADIENANVPYSGPELLKRVKENRRAVILEALNAVKIFDIPVSAVRAFHKALADDEAYYINGTEVCKVKLIS